MQEISSDVKVQSTTETTAPKREPKVHDYRAKILSPQNKSGAVIKVEQRRPKRSA